MKEEGGGTSGEGARCSKNDVERWRWENRKRGGRKGTPLKKKRFLGHFYFL